MTGARRVSGDALLADGQLALGVLCGTRLCSKDQTLLQHKWRWARLALSYQRWLVSPPPHCLSVSFCLALSLSVSLSLILSLSASLPRSASVSLPSFLSMVSQAGSWQMEPWKRPGLRGSATVPRVHSGSLWDAPDHGPEPAPAASPRGSSLSSTLSLGAPRHPAAIP